MGSVFKYRYTEQCIWFKTIVDCCLLSLFNIHYYKYYRFTPHHSIWSPIHFTWHQISLQKVYQINIYLEHVNMYTGT